MIKYLIYIGTLIIIVIIFIKFYVLGYLFHKEGPGQEICKNLKKDEICVCEKYIPPLCTIKKNNLKPRN